VLWSGQSGGWLLQGLLTTLAISFLAWLLAMGLGLLAGALRTLPWASLRAGATAYVEFFRNVPLLVWMFFWYFGVPPLLPRPIRDWLFSHGAEFWAGLFALGVYHGARMAEVIRSGIQSIPRTQFEASLAIGLSVGQAYRLVIVPIALRLIVPPVTSESLNLLKNSSVALTISVAELTFQTRQIETYTARAIEALTAGTLLYLGLCLAIAGIMTRVERRFAIPGMIVRVGAG
jgi:glutamate/aspartate transport system permease protein